MTPYELMIKTNHYLIQGGVLSASQKANITNQFLSNRSSGQAAEKFYAGVKYPNNIDAEKRRMYPIFFIPPYNDGKKLQTVIPLSPKTHILSANAYELEIIRLLYLFAPDHTIVQGMVTKTLERLKTTCFGYQDCAVGECFHSALIVLRFLAAAAPAEREWISKLLAFFKRHMEEKLLHRGKGIHSNVLWYYWLCLSELPLPLAEPEILRYRDRIVGQLSRSSVMNSENDKTNHPVMICAIRNTLSRLTEYAYIQHRTPYVSEKDNRLHFDMNPAL